jgi:PKD repeat protein
MSTCAAGPCKRVTLVRQRAHGSDSLLLHRTSSGKLSGNGRFYVPLRCGGRTYQRGGIAYFRVRLTVRRARVVQGTPFATTIAALYTNSRRVNRTPCAGSIGRDAGTYSGRLAGAVPSPPTADFSSSLDAARRTVSFADRSRAAAGAEVARWRWDFGDPESGPSNVSKLENPSHHYRSSGSYTITLTVTDSNGLTTSLSRQITA